MNGKTAQKQVDGKEKGGNTVTMPRSELRRVKSNWFTGGIATAGAIALAATVVFGPMGRATVWDEGKDKLEKIRVTETKLKILEGRMEKCIEEHESLMEEWDAKKKKFNSCLSILQRSLSAIQSVREVYEKGSAAEKVAEAKEEKLGAKIEKLEAKEEAAFASWQQECDLNKRKMDKVLFLVRNWGR